MYSLFLIHKDKLLAQDDQSNHFHWNVKSKSNIGIFETHLDLNCFNNHCLYFNQYIFLNNNDSLKDFEVIYFLLTITIKNSLLSTITGTVNFQINFHKRFSGFWLWLPKKICHLGVPIFNVILLFNRLGWNQHWMNETLITTLLFSSSMKRVSYLI